MNNLVNQVSRTFFGAAIAGSGLMFGRDVYKGGKKGADSIGGVLALILIVFGLFYLPYYAGNRMFRGYRRGIVDTLGLTIGLNAMILCLSFGLCVAFDDISSKGFEDKTPIEFSIKKNMGEAKFVAALFGIGALIGLCERIKRKRMFAVEDANEEFLKKNGIYETGVETAPYQDAHGNSLRLLDVGKTKLVFMAVGRRNKRAFIDLDKTGRMMKYTGPMQLYP